MKLPDHNNIQSVWFITKLWLAIFALMLLLKAAMVMGS